MKPRIDVGEALSFTDIFFVVCNEFPIFPYKLKKLYIHEIINRFCPDFGRGCIEL